MDGTRPLDGASGKRSPIHPIKPKPKPKQQHGMGWDGMRQPSFGVSLSSLLSASTSLRLLGLRTTLHPPRPAIGRISNPNMIPVVIIMGFLSLSTVEDASM
ncbi:hypothetical protein FALBO_2317 [Fusarium albosuccineum]|uniref:Uncharacterized protein n=1 Tax=Fusarium albosuccineum TaxID=1237068 RepID=A0A8H4LLN6_9HYPO|nr:hypothetical protein FALBO_2317 [Fusarium albosuccineum]